MTVDVVLRSAQGGGTHDDDDTSKSDARRCVAWRQLTTVGETIAAERCGGWVCVDEESKGREGMLTCGPAAAIHILIFASPLARFPPTAATIG